MKKNIKIPSIKECYALMQRFNMLPNIQEHSKKVMQVAINITEHLKPTQTINNELIQAAALLHDITKTNSLKSGEAHDITGKKLLTELGYPEIGDIISEHINLNNFKAEGPVEEKEIIFYADKRVMHDKIVSVEVRIKDLIKRYNHIKKSDYYIEQVNKQLKLLELKLQKHLISDLDTIIRKIS